MKKKKKNDAIFMNRILKKRRLIETKGCTDSHEGFLRGGVLLCC